MFWDCTYIHTTTFIFLVSLSLYLSLTIFFTFSLLFHPRPMDYVLLESKRGRKRPLVYLTVHYLRSQGGVGGIQQSLLLGGSIPRLTPLPFYIPFLTDKVPLLCTFHLKMVPFLCTFPSLLIAKNALFLKYG